jgi:hypothetical protein
VIRTQHVAATRITETPRPDLAPGVVLRLGGQDDAPLLSTLLTDLSDGAYFWRFLTGRGRPRAWLTNL